MREITCKSLFNSVPFYLEKLFRNAVYPWEILPRINGYIEEIYDLCLEKGFIEYSPGILIGKEVKIPSSATIMAPAIIGHECVIRPGAYIRGNVITGTGCVIGNSCEIKNAILLDYAQIPHFNYVGDSVIGNHAHMGASSVCSNLKADRSSVIVRSTPPINSGLTKFGAIIADNAEVGCGCVLNPGTVVCQNSRIYPLTSVRGVIQGNSIMKSADNIVPIK